MAEYHSLKAQFFGMLFVPTAKSAVFPANPNRGAWV
jgi:hypothetical protein